MSQYPNRIVCLTEETTEMLYILGQQHRIVGISGFTYRPAHARKEKPIVSTFLDAFEEKIEKADPDLIIGFSDIQADIAQQLIKKGYNVWITNQRSVSEILDTMQMLGAITGCSEKAQAWSEDVQNKLIRIQQVASLFKKRPKVYFEEWYDPLITCIQWVSELIEIAGGDNILKEQSTSSLAKGRIIENTDKVIELKPDIILASWCGKAFKEQKVRTRNGWDTIPALQNDQIFEIDSTIILQPGPAALTEGVEILHKIFIEFQSLS